MTIISDATPAVESTRGKQKAAALALAHLLDHDLPEAHWHVHRYIQDLGGHIADVDSHRTVEQVRDALGVYARFLGAEVTERDADDRELIKLQVRGVYRDVPVRVWAYIAAVVESAVQA